MCFLLWVDSPISENMESETLAWRYQFSNMISNLFASPRQSSDLTIVEFDDLAQFDLGIARFNEERSHEVLAQVITIIEKAAPAIIVVDLDLRGTTNANLIRVMKRYRNVVLALFGSLEGSTDLPAADYLAHAAAYGYDELLREPNGLTCRLPISTKDRPKSLFENIDQASLVSVPSLTEATIDLSHKIKGVGPQSQLYAIRADQPLYIDFSSTIFPKISMRDIFDANFQAKLLKNRIVILGATFTQRRTNPNHTPLSKAVPDVFVQANSIESLLNNQIITSFPKDMARHMLLLLAVVSGALSAILPLGKRSLAIVAAVLTYIISGQEVFSFSHLAIPIVSPLAVLSMNYIVGTVIHLDTDLRERNVELAVARESMQMRAEEERQRIAEDLHDETLPALSFVARMADNLANELGNNPIPGEMRKRLDNAVDEMRRVINDLHPSVIETMGFKPALENLLSQLGEESKTNVQFIDEDGLLEDALSDFAKMQLYRIVQEALNNVQKHAKATQVSLFIGVKNSLVTIAVVDNGKGIDSKLIRPDSHGLLNIHQRAQLINARVDWRKPRNYTSGTEFTVKLNLPIKDQGVIKT